MPDLSQKALEKAMSRRQAIKVGGMASLGLVFTTPLINTIYPKPAFANYSLPDSDAPFENDIPEDLGGPPPPTQPSQAHTPTPTQPSPTQMPTPPRSDDDDDGDYAGSSADSSAGNSPPTGENAHDNCLSTPEAMRPFGDNLVALWWFNNVTKDWSIYVPTRGINQIECIHSGQTYLLQIKRNQTVNLNGEGRRLLAVWSYIVW